MKQDARKQIDRSFAEGVFACLSIAYYNKSSAVAQEIVLRCDADDWLLDVARDHGDQWLTERLNDTIAFVQRNLRR